MDNQPKSLYYFVHLKIAERFGVNGLFHMQEVANFLANRFRIPRQIKKKVILELESLGMVQISHRNKVKINEVKQTLYI